MSDGISKHDAILTELKEYLLQKLTQENIISEFDLRDVVNPDLFPSDFFTRKTWRYRNFLGPDGEEKSLKFMNSLLLQPGEVSAIKRSDNSVGLFYYASLFQDIGM